MEKFFKPALLLMNSLRYPKKLAVLMVMAVFALAIMTYQLTQQSIDIADFSKKEIVGVKYIDPLLKVIQSLIAYRSGYNTYLMTSNATNKDKLEQIQAQVDSNIVEFDAIDKQYGDELNTSATWNAFKADWSEYSKHLDPNTSASQMFSHVNPLVAALQNLIVIVADSSNLTLDPDIDTYYLMDIYTTKISYALEQALHADELILLAAHNKTVSMDEHQQLIELKNLMSANLKLTQTDLKKVFDQNPAMTAILSDGLNTYSQQINNTIKIGIEGALTGDLTHAASMASEQSVQFRNSGFVFFKAVGNNLRDLIQVRVNKTMSKLYTNLAIATASFLLLAYLFAALYLATMASLQGLISGSNQIATGNLDKRVSLVTHDELLQVANSFNAMCDVLQNIVTEMGTVIKNMREGDFSAKIDMQNKMGFAKDMGEVINEVIALNRAAIDDVLNFISTLANGDLTRSIKSGYKGYFAKLEQYTAQTVKKLENLIIDFKLATKKINNSAKDISTGSTNLSRRTEQQAASLEETSSSIAQLATTVKQNAENAKRANQLSSSASEIAVKGGEVFSQVISTMASINESSNKIVQIISVIDGIAFQTNILALNAAVEAARAGEQGRGFGVVANEVRNLAQRSASAAKEIKELITSSVEKVEVGKHLVDDAGHTMEKIVSATSQVNEIVKDITAASIEQSLGIEQVNQAVQQMDEITLRNSALVEELTSASKSLEVLTDTMLQSLKVFKVNDSVLNQRMITQKIISHTEAGIVADSGGLEEDTDNSIQTLPDINGSLDKSDKPSTEWKEF